MTLGNIAQRIQITRLARNVHRHDGSSLGSNPVPNVFGVDVEAAIQAVTQNWASAEVLHNGGCRCESVSRQQNFLAGLQTDRIQSQLQSGGGRINGQRIFAADVRGKFLFESLRDGSGGEPAGGYHAKHSINLLPAETRAVERNEVVH